MGLIEHIRQGNKAHIDTFTYLGEALNVSPKYLSSLLRILTGQRAQQDE